MALVASSSARIPSDSGPLTQHELSPDPGEGYKHSQSQNTGDASASSLALPSSHQKPELEKHPYTGAHTAPSRFRGAGFFRRLAAALVDFALLLPVCALAGLLLCLAFDQPMPRLAELSPDILLAALLDRNAASEVLLILSAILFFLYFFVFHLARGQTPGKQLLRLRVIDAYGGRPGFWRTLLRTFGYVLSALLFSLGFLWIGFDRERRALHDWLAGTYVVRIL